VCVGQGEGALQAQAPNVLEMSGGTGGGSKGKLVPFDGQASGWLGWGPGALATWLASGGRTAVLTHDARSEDRYKKAADATSKDKHLRGAVIGSPIN